MTQAQTRTLCIEIGTEEIPAFDLVRASTQMGTLISDLLDAAGIAHGTVEVFDTPRRLITLVADVPEETEALSERYKGPSVSIAFDESGAPTKAAQGFARGKGLDAADLVVEDGYVYAQVDTPAKKVATLLPEIIDSLIKGISWPKAQRWGSHHETFSRPVRWIVALFGDEVIPYTFAGVESGRQTRGHRFLAPEPIELATAGDLVPALRDAFIVPTAAEREAVIRQGVAEVEQKTGLTAVLPPKTLTEVVNLAEYPTVVEGVFDEVFLTVPQEIIVDAMLMHQRYFPLYDADGALTNHFLIVSNGAPENSAVIADGNERVVRARLYDAKFFYDEDLKNPLENSVEKLSDVVFQEKLGTVLQKTQRVQELAGYLADEAQLPATEKQQVERAAYLAKADLVSNAVIEFTSVQGVMGYYYAQAQGEDEPVAVAIKDHYKPRFAGDELPSGVVGKIVAVADKLDTICGMFAIGQGPTGSSDPFAVRRSAIGIIAVLRDGLPVKLDGAIEQSLKEYAQQGLEFDEAAVAAEIRAFFVTRTKVMLKDEGVPVPMIDAVLAVGVTEPMSIIKRVKALQEVSEGIPETMEDLAIAYARANNLQGEGPYAQLDESLMNPSELALIKAIEQAKDTTAAGLAADDHVAVIKNLATLRDPIDTFFEDVMVMDEDEALRNNRLSLLHEFVSVFEKVADFSLLGK